MRSLTLLELLVVVTLIGIAATLATVQLSKTGDRAALQAATSALEQTFRLARLRALSAYEPVRVVFELRSPRYGMALTGDPMRSRAESVAWQRLERVNITRGGFRTVVPDKSSSLLTVTLTPRGTSLPWALELEAHHERRVVWSDGIRPRISWRDGILEGFRWDDVAEVARP